MTGSSAVLEAVGERIRTRRERLGLTQRDVANGLQVSAQAVSKWERGENAPDVGVLLALSRLLGVSLDWLLGGHAPSDEGGRPQEVFEATVLVAVFDVERMAAKMTQSHVAATAECVRGLIEPMPMHEIGKVELATFKRSSPVYELHLPS
jgi:DNA-binding XRE family transcriptional regulator